MKLIIFPGTGSPDNPLYVSVYGFLERAAVARGYDSVDASLRWPGHEHRGVLTLDGAIALAKAKFEEIEALAEPYDVLARSFGCYVALKTVLNVRLKLLRKVVLWGPPPYWLMWEMFVRDIEKNRQVASEKGTAVDESLFPSLVPIESMLPEISYETVVATGAQDPYVPHSYLEYLATLVERRKSSKICQSVRFKQPVPGAVHEVTEDAPAPVVDAYLKALFE